jgi:hypothetical protein
MFVRETCHVISLPSMCLSITQVVPQRYKKSHVDGEDVATSIVTRHITTMEGHPSTATGPIGVPTTREEQLALYFGANERIQYYQRKIHETGNEFAGSMGTYCDHQTKALRLQKECGELRNKIEELQKELFGRESEKEMHVLNATHTLNCMIKMRGDVAEFQTLQKKATDELVALVDVLRGGNLSGNGEADAAAAMPMVTPMPMPLTSSTSAIAAPPDPRLQQQEPTSRPPDIQEILNALRNQHPQAQLTPGMKPASFVPVTNDAPQEAATSLYDDDDLDVAIKRERDYSDDETASNERQKLHRPMKFRLPSRRPPVRYCDYFNKRKNGCYRSANTCTYAHRCNVCSGSSHGSWECGVEAYDSRC